MIGALPPDPSSSQCRQLQGEHGRGVSDPSVACVWEVDAGATADAPRCADAAIQKDRWTQHAIASGRWRPLPEGLPRSSLKPSDLQCAPVAIQILERQTDREPDWKAQELHYSASEFYEEAPTPDQKSMRARRNPDSGKTDRQRARLGAVQYQGNFVRPGSLRMICFT